MDAKKQLSTNDNAETKDTEVADSDKDLRLYFRPQVLSAEALEAAAGSCGGNVSGKEFPSCSLPLGS